MHIYEIVLLFISISAVAGGILTWSERYIFFASGSRRQNLQALPVEFIFFSFISTIIEFSNYFRSTKENVPR